MLPNYKISTYMLVAQSGKVCMTSNFISIILWNTLKKSWYHLQIYLKLLKQKGSQLLHRSIKTTSLNY